MSEAMKWRDSWTYGIRELVIEGETRLKDSVLGTVKMERGTISGFCRDRFLESEYYYDKYDFPCPENYRKIQRAVEYAVILKENNRKG